MEDNKNLLGIKDFANEIEEINNFRQVIEVLGDDSLKSFLENQSINFNKTLGNVIKKLQNDHIGKIEQYVNQQGSSISETITVETSKEILLKSARDAVSMLHNGILSVYDLLRDSVDLEQISSVPRKETEYKRVGFGNTIGGSQSFINIVGYTIEKDTFNGNELVNKLSEDLLKIKEIREFLVPVNLTSPSLIRDVFLEQKDLLLKIFERYKGVTIKLHNVYFVGDYNGKLGDVPKRFDHGQQNNSILYTASGLDQAKILMKEFDTLILTGSHKQTNPQYDEQLREFLKLSTSLKNQPVKIENKYIDDNGEYKKPTNNDMSKTFNFSKMEQLENEEWYNS